MMITLKWQLSVDTPTEKVWFSEDGIYRIRWRSEFMGITVLPEFLACVLEEINGKKSWGIVSRHKKEFLAKQACQKHARKKAKAKPEKKKRRRRFVQRGVVIKKV
jgi:hypothetical protein